MESLRAIAKAIKKYPVAIPAKGSSVSIHPGLFPTSMSDFKNDRPSKKEGESKEQYDDKFEQTVRKEYLSALQLPYLARLNPRNESYDYKSAHSFTNGIQSTLRRKNAQNVMFSLSGQSVAKLISVLLQLTKTPLPLPEESRIFPREVFTDIPAITEDIVKDERLFSDYIALISHSEFHFRGSSRQRGIIPKLLRNLLHPSNLRTASLKSASAFNDAIYYFGKKYDFATCRELYAQMKSEGISPTAKTYNLLLLNLVRNENIAKQKLPFDEAIHYLEEMHKHKLSADIITWNTCYFMLKDDISRAIFLEKMTEKNVPITQSLISGILKKTDIPSSVIFEFLFENKIPMNNRLIQIYHEKLVSEGKYEESWKLIQYANKLKYFIKNPIFLDVYLRSLAEKGRIDMALLTFNTFVTKYGLKPTVHSYHMLFKCLVRSGYHKNFHHVYNVLMKNFKGLTGDQIIMDHWIVKSRSILKYNIKKCSNANDILDLDVLMKNAFWDDARGMKWNCWLDYPEYRKLFRKLGSVPSKKDQIKIKKSPETKSDVDVRKLKKAYLKHNKESAIGNKKLQNKPYTSNYYAALKNDLSHRGILNSNE